MCGCGNYLASSCLGAIAIDQPLQGGHLAGLRLQLVEARANVVLIQVGGTCARRVVLDTPENESHIGCMIGALARCHD